jgi:farnesyl-diphosphate farnesyltransferase
VQSLAERLVADEEYQERALPGVSRTFALTIPQLPPPLSRVVINGYLLCRLADTIEDDVRLSAEEKDRYHARFVAVVDGREAAEPFAAELAADLSPACPAAEQELVRNTARVVRLTHSFNPIQRRALSRCVKVMGEGMARFEHNLSLAGLADLTEMDRYCYHVAGCVGEMLTELFCDYSPAIAAHRGELLPLAVSFGQGLQMTNILKDVWDDRRRGACWLPREVYARAGARVDDLLRDHGSPPAQRAYAELLGVALAHLRNAVAYVTLIPRRERGIRRFCLWAIGMAVLTLRKIHRNPGFSAGDQVKISRRSVKATIFATEFVGGSNLLLRLSFATLVRGMPALPDLRTTWVVPTGVCNG